MGLTLDTDGRFKTDECEFSNSVACCAPVPDVRLIFGFYHAYFRAHPGYLVGWKEIVAVLTHGERAIRRWRDSCTAMV